VDATISETIEGEWLLVEPIRAGSFLPGAGTPALYVTLSRGATRFRVDVYPYDPDCYAFQDAIVWRDNLVIGIGSYVHAVSLRDRSVVTIALDDYFGYLYPTTDYLLVASGGSLYRMEPDRTIAWQNSDLAIDGVVVSDPGPPIILGEGEMDPPGGWIPFSLLASNGQRCELDAAAHRVEIVTEAPGLLSAYDSGLVEDLQAVRIRVTNRGESRSHVVVNAASAPFVVVSSYTALEALFHGDVVALIRKESAGQVTISCESPDHGARMGAAIAVAVLKRSWGWDESPVIRVTIEGVCSFVLDPVFDERSWLVRSPIHP